MHLKLEPYQELLKSHLLTHPRAAAFVGIGLGKTATTLSAIHELMLEGVIRSALVVAPLRVATLTWPNEIAKWDQFRWMKVESLRGQKPSGTAQVYTINYEQLQNVDNLDFCDLVIFDELTKAKNPTSERIKHIRPLLRDHWRWGLTGTPRPNSLLELFAQIRLLDDGARLGKAFHLFRDTYFVPIDYNQYNWKPKPEAERYVYQKIQDITLTLRTCDHLDLPEALLEDILVRMPEGAMTTYKKLEKEMLVYLLGECVTAVNAAVLVNKLLQVTGGAIYTEERLVIEVHSAKIKALKSLLVDLEGERTIIFTNFIHERERVCKAIGGTDAAKFSGDIEAAWNAGEIEHLVADPRSLGHGLNLQTGGRNVIWFSPNWSRELYDQANGRIFRKGQTEAVRIYRLICPGTIDDAVIEGLREKGDGQSEMLQILANYRKIKLV